MVRGSDNCQHAIRYIRSTDGLATDTRCRSDIVGHHLCRSCNTCTLGNTEGSIVGILSTTHHDTAICRAADRAGILICGVGKGSCLLLTNTEVSDILIALVTQPSCLVFNSNTVVLQRCELREGDITSVPRLCLYRRAVSGIRQCHSDIAQQ